MEIVAKHSDQTNSLVLIMDYGGGKSLLLRKSDVRHQYCHTLYISGVHKHFVQKGISFTNTNELSRIQMLSASDSVN